MQTVHATLDARLATTERKPCFLVEIYASDYVPPSGGFDPADAEELFAAIQIEWDGNEYRQLLKQNPSITKTQGESLNTCSLTFSNLDRYIAAYVVNEETEGKYCVVRLVERDITAGSAIQFVGKLEHPGDIGQKDATLTAKQAVGAFSFDFPPRRFPPEGYIFHPQQGTFIQPVLNDQGRLIKPYFRTAQWSSIDSTHYGDPIPYILGRVQLDTHSILDVDAGTVIKALHYICEGKLNAVTNIRQVIGAPYSQPLNVTIHLGEADGVGTQTVDPLFPALGYTFPDLAYLGFEVTGSSANAVDPPPYVVCVAIGEYALPDGSGDFTLAGATDNPAYLWRHLMTDPRMFNQPESLIDDDAVLEVARYCDELLVDETNAERRILQSVDFAEAGTAFINHRSTGVIDTDYYRDTLGLTVAPPFEREALYEDGGDITEPPDPEDFGIIPVTRKRYTVNVPITESVNSQDFLFKTFYPACGMYHVTGANGKLQPRIKKPAHNTATRGATLAGATSIPVQDVTPWRASLAGLVLIEPHEAAAEVRTASAANYSTAGNAITLVKSVTGTITATVSGATLSGGNNSNTPATGSVTIGGTPASGNTVTITINGFSVELTLNSSDTTGTVAALLADLINADPDLKRFVSASWVVASPNLISLTSKLGTLTVAALTNPHASAVEVMRVAFSFDNSNVAPGSFKWPMGSKQKSYNQVEIIHREASDDFAIQPPLRINDTENQEKVKKINVLKIDGSGIDNFHQAYRRANQVFSEVIEGSKFATWKTKTGRALLLEEGDIVCVSDDSTGLVNYPVRLEVINLSGEAEITFTGRQYSSLMYSDEAVAHDIRIPSTLRGAKPADVENFIIEFASRGGIRLKWDADANEARVITYRIERKDGAGSWYDAAIVTGTTWTDHTLAIEEETRWRIVALAGGARESETPTEVMFDVSFYGTLQPTVTKESTRDSILVTITPSAGLNDSGRASVMRTEADLYVFDFFDIEDPITVLSTVAVDGMANQIVIPDAFRGIYAPDGEFQDGDNPIRVRARYTFIAASAVFPNGMPGDYGLGGNVIVPRIINEDLPMATTSLQGAVVKAAHNATTAGAAVQADDPRLANNQPLDSDLTAIAALSPSNDDIIQRKSGAWTNRTVSQLKTDLGLNTTNTPTFATVTLSTGLVVGTQFGGYVTSGHHRAQINATGTQTTLFLSGGGACLELWKNLPVGAGDFGVGIGMAVPQTAATNDLTFSTYSTATGWVGRGRVTNSGNTVFGSEAVLATNATDGFVHIPVMAGTPTGAPTAYTGKVAMVFDSSGTKLWIYLGGVWRYVTLT